MSLGLKIIVGILLAGSLFIIIGTMIGSRKGIRSLILTAFQGLAAIFAVNVVGMLTGVTIAVNWYTLGTGVVCGTPGVITLLMFKLLFRT